MQDAGTEAAHHKSTGEEPSAKHLQSKPQAVPPDDLKPQPLQGAAPCAALHVHHGMAAQCELLGCCTGKTQQVHTGCCVHGLAATCDHEFTGMAWVRVWCTLRHGAACGCKHVHCTACTRRLRGSEHGGMQAFSFHVQGKSCMRPGRAWPGSG